jgi:transcriptional regulator with XRE-family HTH domain
MKLRTARVVKGMTQTQLAAKSGVPQQFISRLERGDASNPAHRAVMAICRALGVDPAAIDEFHNGGRL